MSNVSFILLYVENVARSADFYSRLLDKPVPEASPNFALLPVGPGLMLGLWKRDDVAPAPEGRPGASEIAITLEDDAAVDAAHARWAAQGAVIAQTPTSADFGYTCLALDPDGHRVRAFHPAER
jgi:predicted enzyme related to lactoylglutathione lyase